MFQPRPASSLKSRPSRSGTCGPVLAEAHRFDAYILGGRPHSSRQTVEVAQAAHAIIIPTGQTKDDLRPAVQLAHSLVDVGIEPARIQSFAAVQGCFVGRRQRCSTARPSSARLNGSRRSQAVA